MGCQTIWNGQLMTSGTNTEQEIKQKNIGSGESRNNNCALNSFETTLVPTVACLDTLDE
jgi:hypothetical protein